MKPDFAIILNFKLDSEQKFDPDFLVKTARNIGARAVSGSDQLKEACAKYTIFLASNENGLDLSANNVIDTMVTNRKNGQATIINIPINSDGKFDTETTSLLNTINNWMHMFGHAFNEAEKSSLTVDQNGFVLKNRHAPYQKYVFLKSPLAQEITISGLSEEPNRVEWIENRVDLTYSYQDQKLKIQLTKPDNDWEWQVLRIQAHRPEDDIKETKF